MIHFFSSAHRNSAKSAASHRGFTLVELLVAIGIIAVLAALLFPVFKNVRDRAKVTQCSNNLQQLGVAFQQYLQDNAQRYPGGGQYQEWANGGHWVGADQNGNNNSGTNAGAPVALTDPALSTQPYTGAEAKPEKGGLYPYVKSPAILRLPFGTQRRIQAPHLLDELRYCWIECHRAHEAANRNSFISR